MNAALMIKQTSKEAEFWKRVEEASTTGAVDQVMLALFKSLIAAIHVLRITSRRTLLSYLVVIPQDQLPVKVTLQSHKTSNQDRQLAKLEFGAKWLWERLAWFQLIGHTTRPLELLELLRQTQTELVNQLTSTLGLLEWLGADWWQLKKKRSMTDREEFLVIFTQFDLNTLTQILTFQRRKCDTKASRPCLHSWTSSMQRFVCFSCNATSC